MKQVKPEAFYVYEFIELNDAAKQVAYDVLKDIIVDDRFDWFHDDSTTSIEESYELKDVKVSYSLSSSQGDGFSFEVKTFNTNIINDLIMKDESVTDILKKIITKLNELNAFNVSVNKKDEWRYAYAARFQVEVDVNEDYQDIITDKEVKQIQEVYADVYMKIARQYEKDGYRLYDVTLEEVEEFAMSNGYEFYEDGRQY
jgi:hypothetical protein